MLSVKEMINQTLGKHTRLQDEAEKLAAANGTARPVPPAENALALADEIRKLAEEFSLPEGGASAVPGGDEPAKSTGDNASAEPEGGVAATGGGDEPEKSTGDNKSADASGEVKAEAGGDHVAVSTGDEPPSKTAEEEKGEGKDKGTCEKCGKDPCECPKDEETKQAAEALGVYLVAKEAVAALLKRAEGTCEECGKDPCECPEKEEPAKEAFDWGGMAGKAGLIGGGLLAGGALGAGLGAWGAHRADQAGIPEEAEREQAAFDLGQSMMAQQIFDELNANEAPAEEEVEPNA